MCEWWSVKSRAFQAPRALWDRVAKGSLVGAAEICELSIPLQMWCADPAVLFQEYFSRLLSLLPVLKVKTAIMQVLGRTGLKRVDWAQREVS